MGDSELIFSHLLGNHCEMVSLKIKQPGQIEFMLSALASTISTHFRPALLFAGVSWIFANIARASYDALGHLTCVDDSHVHGTGRSMNRESQVSNFVTWLSLTPSRNSFRNRKPLIAALVFIMTEHSLGSRVFFYLLLPVDARQHGQISCEKNINLWHDLNIDCHFKVYETH